MYIYARFQIQLDSFYRYICNICKVPMPIAKLLHKRVSICTHIHLYACTYTCQFAVLVASADIWLHATVLSRITALLHYRKLLQYCITALLHVAVAVLLFRACVACVYVCPGGSDRNTALLHVVPVAVLLFRASVAFVHVCPGSSARTWGVGG